MIICSAVKVVFYRLPEPVEAVIPGLRHSDCWNLMSTLGVSAVQQESTEGFVDHIGAFLDRADALAHAMSCGQLSDTTRTQKFEKQERVLYSEDLY